MEASKKERDLLGIAEQRVATGGHPTVLGCWPPLVQTKAWDGWSCQRCTINSMKVAISVPVPVFKAAEALARKLKKSRSELYLDAIAAYVGQRPDTKSVTEKLDLVYSRASSRLDSVLLKSQLLHLAPELW